MTPTTKWDFAIMGLVLIVVVGMLATSAIVQVALWLLPLLLITGTIAIVAAAYAVVTVSNNRKRIAIERTKQLEHLTGQQPPTLIEAPSYKQLTGGKR